MKTLLFSFCILLSCIAAPLSAAGPITHAYLAKQFFHLKPTYSESDRTAFLIGTLFPDIRYLGCVERCETHYPTMPLQEVLKEPSPFLAGVKFHSFVDNERIRFLTLNKLDAKLSRALPRRIRNFSFFLKLIEDEILFSTNDWAPITNALTSLHPAETESNIPLPHLLKWHNLLSLAFMNPPSNLLFFFHRAGFSSYPSFDRKTIAEWDDIILETAASKLYQDYVRQMLSFFDAQMRPGNEH